MKHLRRSPWQNGIVRTRGRPATEFANKGAVSQRDAAALSSATGREEGLAQDEPLSDFEADVQAHPAGGRPLSETIDGPQGGTLDEDGDGLDDVARALRDAAEGPVGRKEISE